MNLNTSITYIITYILTHSSSLLSLP